MFLRLPIVHVSALPKPASLNENDRGSATRCGTGKSLRCDLGSARTHAVGAVVGDLNNCGLARTTTVLVRQDERFNAHNRIGRRDAAAVPVPTLPRPGKSQNFPVFRKARSFVLELLRAPSWPEHNLCLSAVHTRVRHLPSPNRYRH